MSTLCAICGKKIILGYKGPNKELLCKECWEERRVEYLRSVIGEWQECPICGSKGCFEVKGTRFFQQILLCKSCSAEWILGPRKLTNLMLTKSDLNGKARKNIGKSHPPEWWAEMGEHMRIREEKRVEESKEELIAKLDKRLINGEISEETYKQILERIKNMSEAKKSEEQGMEPKTEVE